MARRRPIAQRPRRGRRARRAPSPTAAARLRSSPASARRPRSAKRPIIRRDGQRAPTARGEQARVAPDRDEIDDPSAKPAGEMRGQADEGDDGRRASRNRQAHRAVHPFPGRPARRAPTRASAAARSRRCPESNVVVEPAAERTADQHRRDDHPAEHADLREAARRPTARPRAAGAAGARRAAGRLRPADRCLRRARARAALMRHPAPRPSGPEVAHDLADRVQLQARALDTFRSARSRCRRESGRAPFRRASRDRRPGSPRGSRSRCRRPP